MSSPCLCRAPLCGTRLPEVKLGLKTGREGPSRAGGGTREASGRVTGGSKETPGRASAGNRSRSTPPVHRAQQSGQNRRSKRTKPEPQHQPEKNGTLLGIPSPEGPGLLSLTSSSSPSSASGCHSPLPPPPTFRNMRRARWLSYSTSNISFPSILDGRFRQLQGTVVFRYPESSDPSTSMSLPVRDEELL